MRNASLANVIERICTAERPSRRMSNADPVNAASASFRPKTSPMPSLSILVFPPMSAMLPSSVWMRE